ncbi:MAG: hypothetical protein JWM93_1778 [Frankiales bacterium]|nr:hypothetical protein [Frankiales bacterium]
MERATLHGMPTVRLDVTMSLDGFIAGPDVGVEQPMGKGGLRLHEWLFEASPGDVDAVVAEQMRAITGAVVLGRRTFDVGVGVWEDTPFPAPCFVVTHRPRGPLVQQSGTFAFVTDGIASAVRQAADAASDGHVRLMGADIARQCLAAGLVDELHLQLAPVLLGAGTRLFGDLATGPAEWERTAVIESPHVTHLHFRVRRPGP